MSQAVYRSRDADKSPYFSIPNSPAVQEGDATCHLAYAQDCCSTRATYAHREIRIAELSVDTCNPKF